MAFLKQSYFRGPYSHQNWSLPESVIFYMTKNPSSSNVYQKLTQSCKYFHAKNPIIVAEELYRSGNGKCLIRWKKEQEFLSKVSNKLWISDIFDMERLKSTSIRISSMIPKIYRIGAWKLKLGNHHISFNELSFLSSNVQDITFDRTIVRDEDGLIVPLEKLVETLPKVKSFIFRNNVDSDLSLITANTVKELLQLSNFTKIRSFSICNIPEVFDIDTFFTFVKKNKYTKFCLTFGTVSEVYKDCLDEIIYEIYNTKNPNYVVPYIFLSLMINITSITALIYFFVCFRIFCFLYKVFIL